MGNYPLSRPLTYDFNFDGDFTRFLSMKSLIEKGGAFLRPSSQIFTVADEFTNVATPFTFTKKEKITQRIGE